jgi:hypothetical protein
MFLNWEGRGISGNNFPKLLYFVSFILNTPLEKEKMEKIASQKPCVRAVSENIVISLETSENTNFCVRLRRSQFYKNQTLIWKHFKNSYLIKWLPK